MNVGPSPRLLVSFAVLAISLPGSLPSSQWTTGSCSGHGHTQIGRCFCDPYWTGAQCDRLEQPPDCGDHGTASNGRCVCERGWSGRGCGTAPPACAHGKLAHRKCVCDPGWSGGACDKGP